ncbi:MAG: 2-C-methyl-D-erythritol 4-phosphate cytidylyltransferase [Pirellulaceae bacterium]|jgi:2-C-methyl-D-erythritol 4-phosphate cytidylyltransferase|nr:2-C-methyl-D-erythritol 4-phosphate cytidylyltransferase [Pirellulaceae bacterium]MDP7020080.1 2-C-methyl-D-erythritol 4-phosphate cytidylyltransferase [Pirellulaceae bacterium]
MSSYAVILPAAGKSSRFRDQHFKKPFAPLNGRPVWMYSAEKFVNRDDVKQVLLVISPEDRDYFQDKFAANAALLGIEVVMGGSERVDSVKNAVEKVADGVEYIAIHDAARPCIAGEWIDRVFQAAQKGGAAILASPVAATLKRVDPRTNEIAETVSREGVWEAQTPQVFRRDLLIDAFARRGGAKVTDEAQLLELAGHPVSVVAGSPINLKITTRGDLKLAEQAIKALPKPKLFGPAHPFEDDDHWK